MWTTLRAGVADLGAGAQRARASRWLARIQRQRRLGRLATRKLFLSGAVSGPLFETDVTAGVSWELRAHSPLMLMLWVLGEAL